MLLWDPFCGSGTILIEAFLLLLEIPARIASNISHEGFTNFVIHNQDEFNKFMRENSSKSYYKLKNESNINSSNFKFIGSDLNAKSIDSFLKNCHTANLSRFKIKNKDTNENNENLDGSDKDKVNKLISNPNIMFEKVNNSFEVYMGDFETIGQKIVFQDKDKTNTSKFSIMTNIPYGTSNEMSNRNQIKALYKRFGKFLRRNIDFIDDIFILVNKRSSYDDLNFKILSEINWETIVSFNNNGIDVDFLHYSKKSVMNKSTDTESDLIKVKKVNENDDEIVRM